jgi:hypothetical protein
MSTSRTKKKGRRATKTQKTEAPPEPLALFPGATPKGYVRVREHLRRLTPKKKKR